MYPQVFGKYVLEGEIARGGMARLMLATLRGAGGFEKKLVVKQIRDELASDENFVKRFVEEAKTTVALSHPNIVPVYELGVEQGTYFLAMELVEGVSIAELLDAGVLSPEEGAYVGAEVCRALDYAHRRMQVVHRDITPRNVMVDEEGQVKLIDFGIAALAQKGTRQVFGSPGHMPPEQMEGKPLGPPADLFALGALLMEAWSKKAPFRRKTPEEIEAALAGPRPKPSEIDPRLLPLDDIMDKVLASDPAARPQEADELGRAFRKFLAGVDTGDIARGLGARVHERREEIRKKKEAPPASSRGGLQRPASRGEMVTKTFAARDEVAQAPIGTRKILSQPPPAEKVETIATRPIETPAKPVTSPRPSRAWLAIAAVVAAAAGGFWLRAEHSPARPVTPPTPTATATVTAAVTVTAPATVTASAPVSPTAPPSASTEVKPPGHLALYGDPGTRAIVDGTSRGTCPVGDVAVEPGDHEVRFIFAPTGEGVSTHVGLKSNDHVSVRADFTATTPAIHVQR